MSEKGIMDQLADAAATAGDRIKETFASGRQATQDAAKRMDDQIRETTARATGDEPSKDRTQTSFHEDAHDLASAAEEKTNQAVNRTREATQAASDRADAAYTGVKSFMADEKEKAKNAMDDMKATAAEKAPGRDTQDARLTEQEGINAGYEAAREMAEKTEDTLIGPQA